MRPVPLALLGIVLGGSAGITTGFVLLFLWVQGLGLPMLTDDPKGLATIALFTLPLMIVGAVGVPVSLVRRSLRGGRMRWQLIAATVVAGPTLIFWLRLLIL